MENTENTKSTKKPVKKSKLIFIILIAVIIYIIANPYISEYVSTESVYGDQITVEVPEGATADDVAGILVDKGLIKSKLTFKLKCKLESDKYKNVYKGTYYLNMGMCLTDIMDVLMTTPPEGNIVSLTVPEGYSIEMIAQKCEDEGLCSKRDFLNAVEATDNFDYEFISHIPDGDYEYKLEGFLFPSTYEYYDDDSAVTIIDKMLAAFEEQYTKYFTSYDNMFENMIIASMVEREAVLDSERETISGVIKNRIKENMLLQIDATVVYAKSKGLYDMTQVLNEDLKVDSPYNLYKNPGLTPGPICNPGIKSIIAAANPEEHSWLYYHTDEEKKDGSHIFTETFGEHLSTMN